MDNEGCDNKNNENKDNSKTQKIEKNKIKQKMNYDEKILYKYSNDIINFVNKEIKV